MTSLKPNFFIIGGPKCGTTAMSRYLNEHEDIYFANPKESFFFNTDFNFDGKRFSNETEYLKYGFPKAEDYDIVGEGTVLYLYSEVAIDNILQFNPESKFIVMLRNPVEMAYSLHSTWVKLGIETVKDFEKAWRLQDNRINGRDLPKYYWDQKMFDYGGICKLGNQVEKLLRKVNHEKVEFIFYDDFKKDTKGAYERVLDFLEVNRDERVEFSVANANAEIRNSGLARFISSISIRLVKISYLKEKLGIPRGVGILPFLRSLNQTTKKRDKMNESLKKELQEYFKKDIELLEAIFSKDLSGWYSS